LVGAPGFEPGASCAQGRRATRLRYAPTVTALFILKHFPTLLLIRLVIFPLEAAKTSGRPRCTSDFDSVLRMVCRWRNTKALHLVKERGALQAKSGSCSSRTSELPIGALASGENFFTHLVFKGGV
jgi:hypothetical protein